MLTCHLEQTRRNRMVVHQVPIRCVVVADCVGAGDAGDHSLQTAARLEPGNLKIHTF